MTGILVEASTDRVVSDNNSLEISPGTSDNESHHKKPTAFASPEAIKESGDCKGRVGQDKESPTAALTSKLNSGIMYRDYISDSSDLNSDSSSLFEDGHQYLQFRQSTGDLTLISKAVSLDTHTGDAVGSSSVVPAERNPVSNLLRSPSSLTSTDGEDSPAVAEAKAKHQRHSVPDLSTTSFYTSFESSEMLATKRKLMMSTSANSLPKQMLRHKKLSTESKSSTDSSDDTAQPQVIASGSETLPPPTSSSHSTLEKTNVHNNREIIPEHDSDTKCLYEPLHSYLDLHQKDTSALPPPSLSQPNTSKVQHRFITMEEELLDTDELSMHTNDDHSPNNLSMIDLALQRAENRKRNEIRSLEQRRSIKRLNAIKELMETEETYSRDLGILCTHFFAIIKEATCITTGEVDILVRNAMDIFAFQEKFTEALIEAHGDKEEERNGIFYKGNLKNIASCFVEWAPKFEIYLDYCVRQDHAVSVYNELLQTNIEFGNLIERLHTFHRVSFGFSRLKFDDYLIIPFQRIFRYRLLLQSISKATQKDSEEYELLSQAQNIIHAIASTINNEKSKMEAKRKTALFLSRLESDWTLPKRWFDTLGVCSLIGTLEVRCTGDNKAKRIGCALFNHYMIMAKAKKHKQYEPRYWFPLRKFEIENLPSIEGSMTYSWLLHSEENTLELSAICELEKQIWMKALTHAIKESKNLYSNSVESNEYLLEQLFVSSFDQYSQPKQSSEKMVESETPVHFSIPNGSSSFSQSAIFNKPSRTNNRSSHPVFTSQDLDFSQNTLTQSNNSTLSPGLRSQSSISDLREFFSNNVTEKWSQRKYNQYHTRCKSVDTKFDDVCTTPILTARANSMNRHGSTKARKISVLPNTNTCSSMISLAKSSTNEGHDLSNTSSPVFYSPSAISESCASACSSRRPSVSKAPADSMIFRLAQRTTSIHRSDSVNSSHTTIAVNGASDAAGMLPPSSSRTLPSARSSKFFGRMVEKLGQIGTPGKRRGRMGLTGSSSTHRSGSASTLPVRASVPFVDKKDVQPAPSTSTKKKFLPQFLQARQIKKQ